MAAAEGAVAMVAAALWATSQPEAPKQSIPEPCQVRSRARRAVTLRKLQLWTSTFRLFQNECEHEKTT
jgi:hypothetical protein